MEPLTIVTGPAAPLVRPNINTDLLAPIRRPDRPASPSALPTTAATNIAEYLLAAWRYDTKGEIAGFVLNRPAFRNATILLAGPNFGCGSSRETAVWALVHFGIRCVIAPSFGTIFHGNCFKNSLLPVTLPLETVEHLSTKVERNGNALPLTVSLVDMTVTTSDGEQVRFIIPDFRRQALLKGLDPIQQTLSYRKDIESFTKFDRVKRPWVYAMP